jgi:hypothetical protein
MLIAFQKLHYPERVAQSTGPAKEFCEKTNRELNGERREPMPLYNIINLKSHRAFL